MEGYLYKMKEKLFGKKTKKETPSVRPSTQFRKSHIPFRLNFLFFIIFALFVALILQMSYLQIANGKEMAARIEWNSKRIVSGNAPRGMIYDANGKALVSNQANQAIIFTKKTGMTAEERFDISNKINQLIAIEPEELSERDKKDYWLGDPKNYKEATERLTEAEEKDSAGNQLTAGEYYSKVVEKVTPEEIAFDETALKAATVFKRISAAYELTPVFIKNRNVTNEEIAVIAENKLELPGISTGMDWERTYPFGDSMSSILGTVTTEQAGLPAEEADYYLAQGYSRNDRVGRSYLEKEYESVLKGTKSQSEVTINNKQEIENQKMVYDGEKGKNLVLTIDKDFQEGVENILKTNYQELINNGKAAHSPGAYVVVNNPKTGEVLAMAGVKRDPETNQLSDDTLGTINNAFVPGSAIKGATIMAGYETGAISTNETLVDEPIVLKSSNPKTSVFNPYNRIPVDSVTALKVSSNVYMMKIVMRMLGVEYSPGMELPLNTAVFEELRNVYGEYGLGSQTGIDLPGEATGFINKSYLDKDGQPIMGIMGNLLDLSYGNYDTYTPMQLAQYVGTIANNGKRMSSHIVKGIYATDDEGNLGALEQAVEPKVLNQVSGTPEQLGIIQQGFHQVVYAGGTGASMSGTKYQIGAKTGTAETFAPNTTDPVINSTVVAYGPFEDPKIAVAVVLPMLKDEKDRKNTIIAQQVMDLYYDMYEKK